MSANNKLLELAAKALGNPKIHWNGAIWCNCERMNEADARGNRYPSEWNPLTDDGDALRLAVKLRLNVMGVMASGNFRYATHSGATYAEMDVDHFAATRRAIVRAAAEIGKAMP